MPGEGLLVLADPEGAIEPEMDPIFRRDPDGVTTLHRDEDISQAGVDGGSDGMSMM